MLLSVIIVNYNVKHFLEQCLCSVQRAVDNIDAEIIVTDNDSTDGSLAYLQPVFPQVKFIANKTNTGFARANNQAFEIATGKYILFLNPDTLLPEDCLRTCIHYLESNEDAGALGIKMVDGCGHFLPESKRAFPSPLTSLFKLLGLSSLFPKSAVFAKYHLGHLSNDANHVVDVLAGAFMMTRKKVLDNVGVFDESFFMYGEDIDLSYRIQKAGWKNLYFAGSSIIHFKGESTKKGSLNYVCMFYQAMDLFVKKHYGKGRAGAFRFFIQLAIWLRAGVSALGNFLKGLTSVNTVQDEAKEYRQTLVVGSQEDYQQVISLMQLANREQRILGRIGFNKNEDNAITSVDRLGIFLNETPVREMVFCVGDQLTLKQAIHFMERQNRSLRYKFHYSGTNSIVGSDSKETTGETFGAISATTLKTKD